MEEAEHDLDGLNIFVNNAARQQTKPTTTDISSEDFDVTLKTNIYAPFWLIKAAVARIGLGAVIVNTSSEQVSDPSEDIVDYALTRAAVLNFTKSMTKQLVRKGTRVNAVVPRPFWTPLQVSGGATLEKLKKFGSQSPLAGLASPLRSRASMWRPPTRHSSTQPARSSARLAVEANQPKASGFLHRHR